MQTAEIAIKFTRKASREQVESAIWEYLVALARNGQLIDWGYDLLAVRGGYKAVVSLPEATSLQASRPSVHVHKRRAELRRHGIAIGKARILGHAVESGQVCRCRKHPSFVLETNFLSSDPPLCCGACFGRVPLYRIPHTTEYGTYEDILGWASRYRALDTLWIDSGVGEQFAYRELSRHDSDLSQTGRDICRRIQELTRIPVYYYLQRHYARSVASERRRTCPACGRKWLVEPPWFDRYDFRCDRCRLVSNIGFDVRHKM